MYKSFETFLSRTPYFPVSALLNFETKQYKPIFREMLQIAMPDLSDGMDKGSDRAQHSAYRYYQRACICSTPFSLFAGCSIGTCADKLNNCEKQKRWQWELIHVKKFKIRIQGLALGQCQQLGSVFFSHTTGILISFIAAKAIENARYGRNHYRRFTAARTFIYAVEKSF